MISFLKGKIIDLELTKALVLTVSGVGYEVFISEEVFAKIQGLEEIDMYIYHHRTENSQNLFGFLEKEDKRLFEELIKINGVGGKVALNILSLGRERLIEAIQNSDKKTLEQIKGIGKKGASKIVLELKDADIITSYLGNTQSGGGKEELKGSQINNEIRENVKTTLIAMGYAQKDIESTLNKLPDSMETLEEIIPFMIKNM